MPPAPPCPCSSGQRYSQCCAPYHRGAEPPDAERLMRSRYAAFALKEVAYLWRTLDPRHRDRTRPEAEVLRELRAFCNTHKFPELRVLGHQPPDASGTSRVLFYAKVFESGKDRSFVELSDFHHDGTGWRYLTGVTKQPRELSMPPEQLTLATFPTA